jgi:hypothetical protein
MKPKACVVDHSFHKVTHSFDFIREILSREYDLHDLWDDAWSGGQHVPVQELNEFDTIFFFQAINPFKELSRIRGHIIWVPMYDDVTRRHAFWMKLSTLPIKIICFSKKLFDFVNQLGIHSIVVQYFPNPDNFTQTKDYQTRRVFFWMRGGIDFDTVTKILGENKIDSMDIRFALDPDVHLPEPDESSIKKYNINIIKGLSTREEYISLVSRNNIFIAPRLREGIGISTLEALTMGQCVIANNDSTMNEYIISGQNGMIFNADNPDNIDLSNFESLARRAHENCITGWNNWQKDIQSILEFVREPRTQVNHFTLIFCTRIVWMTIIDVCQKHIKKLLQLFKVS